MPKGDYLGDGQRRQQGDKVADNRLGDHQQQLPVHPVGYYAADDEQGHVGDAVEKKNDAQLGGGPGDLQHQPAENQESHTLRNRLAGVGPAPITTKVPDQPRARHPARVGNGGSTAGAANP